MKCKYCGIELSGLDFYRQSEHPKLCKNVTPEQRYINSGIPQKDYPRKVRAAILAWEVKE
jgi:hypothetical protein